MSKVKIMFGCADCGYGAEIEVEYSEIINEIEHRDVGHVYSCPHCGVVSTASECLSERVVPCI